MKNRAMKLSTPFAFALLIGGVFCPVLASSSLSDESVKLRDPFKRPAIGGKGAEIPRTELEAIPLEDLKLIGVLTGPDRVKAMVLAPNKKTYFISENQKVGTRGGVVKKVSPDSVKVIEQITNVIGQQEAVEYDLKLNADRVSPDRTE